MIKRRGFLAGLGVLLAAPAIIRTPGLLMPVKAPLIVDVDEYYLPFSPTLSEIVTAALRHRTGWLAESVTRNNALLERLKDRGRLNPVSIRISGMT